MIRHLRNVWLVQLPIPQPGPAAVSANVPLAAGYLKLWARRRGLDDDFDIRILPADLADRYGDQGLVDAILQRQPWLVGFTCYLWNVERTLWIAGQIKRARPETWIVVGGPEITADNPWILNAPAVDFAVFGEGEQTFADLLAALRDATPPDAAVAASRPAMRCDAWSEIPGLWFRQRRGRPCPRTPIARLDDLSSPYREGILDVGDHGMVFLETLRGCAFRCKFCYYPKSYDKQYYASHETIAANLRDAAQRGAREIVLLDPTLNQRRDFREFLELLARNNPDRQFTFFGELRAEGIDAELARLLAAANFSEIEVGLQSLDPKAQSLMHRKVNLEAFERGARAMRDAGLPIRVDLILGLPGDTVESIRRGIEYLAASELFSAVQVFNLSILPGTAFREEAAMHQLHYQARPPYYVLSTPTISTEDMVALMAEAQEAFGLEYDPLPPPTLDAPAGDPSLASVFKIDLASGPQELPPAARRAHAFTLWLKSDDFDRDRVAAAGHVRRALSDNPHTTLQVVLEPTGDARSLSERLFEELSAACYESTSYLDLFYSMHPNGMLGAKRLVALLPAKERERLGLEWIDDCGRYASIVWRGGAIPESELAVHEFCDTKTPVALEDHGR
jgi:radical SAM superfamily enzyme YgiQ (UPF0313 family)